MKSGSKWKQSNSAADVNTLKEENGRLAGQSGNQQKKTIPSPREIIIILTIMLGPVLLVAMVAIVRRHLQVSADGEPHVGSARGWFGFFVCRFSGSIPTAPRTSRPVSCCAEAVHECDVTTGAGSVVSICP